MAPPTHAGRPPKLRQHQEATDYVDTQLKAGLVTPVRSAPDRSWETLEHLPPDATEAFTPGSDPRDEARQCRRLGELYQRRVLAQLLPRNALRGLRAGEPVGAWPVSAVCTTSLGAWAWC